jgi:glycosyltransferase involved in cell wall biosynthesis
MIKFTIITAVWNAQAEIEGTMNSVFEQTYPNIEYWIIDGASTDGTLDFVKKQAKNHAFFWKSEPDLGLYDAMNKGLEVATGDFLVFLNAGDRLFSPKTIENLSKLISEQTDVLYGETMLVQNNRLKIGLMSELSTRKLPKSLTKNSMQRGMVVVHQSFYVRRAVAPRYDLSWKLCADIDWVIKCLENSRETVKSPEILTEYLMGGMSKQRHQASLKERFLILKKHFGLVSTIFNHGIIICRLILHRIFRAGKSRY